MIHSNIFATFDHNIAHPLSDSTLPTFVDFEQHFCVGITFGDFKSAFLAKYNQDYVTFTQSLFEVYQHIQDYFQRHHMGYTIEYSQFMITMLGIFPLAKQDSFTKDFLLPLQEELKDYPFEITIGIGMYAFNEKQIHNSYTTAKYAYRLYFFLEEDIINFQEVSTTYTLSQEDFDTYFDDAFHSILVKNPDALSKIDDLVEIIGKIHFGNHLAVRMRTMNMTGSLTSRLQKYKLFQGDFNYMQDALQEEVLNAVTFHQVKSAVHDYYARFLPDIYHSQKTYGKSIVEKVKTYIQENFMEDLSIHVLSEVAMVSPNYFSHMFKNEVGQNYKDYVKQVRMNHALDLVLNTDYSINSIAEAVGYNNIRTFTDAFKQTYGLSPTKYKKSLK